MNKIESNLYLKPRQICIPVGGSKKLTGDMTVPDTATSLVVLFNGGSNGRKSPAHLFISRGLIERSTATLIVDLLTEDEQLADFESNALKDDVSLLADRVVEVIDWLVLQAETTGLKIGLYASDVTAAATLMAAVRRYKWVSTVVSHSGRPDLVGNSLANLDCPVLFIVGEHDRKLVTLNKKSLALVQCQKELSLIQGASERFDEPGVIEELAELSISWFQTHLA